MRLFGRNFQFGRQPGQQQGQPVVRLKGQTIGRKEAERIAGEVLQLLRRNNDLSDERLRELLSLPDTNNANAAIAAGRAAYEKECLLKPDQGGQATTTTDAGGELQLVNYSPEQIMQQVAERVDRVEFGWTWAVHWMEAYSEVWAVLGPVILVIGTIGEVFLVLWLRQKAQEIIAGLSIVAVALVLEGTFLAVSYKAATIRNRAEKRDGGATALDKKKLRWQFYFWVALALGVCGTQIIFVAAQTNADGIGTTGVWIFAALRSVFTLVADGYTAFAHEEKPTTDERALREDERRTRHINKLLEQENKKIAIINDGILSVRAASTEAKIKEEKLNTRLETERLQNKALLDSLRLQQEQALMFTTLGNNIMRAIGDTSMADEDRAKVFNVLNGLMAANRLIPGSTTVSEEDTSEDDDA